MTAVANVAAGIEGLARRLSAEQDALQRAWSDSRGRRFAAEVLEPLSGEARALVQELSRLDAVLEKALAAARNLTP